MQKLDVEIDSNTIPLDKFLKWSAVIESGGQAKVLIQEGYVKVNGETEKRRSRTLKPGDTVELEEVLLNVIAGQQEV